MSKDMEKIITRLQDDWAFLSEFLSFPELAIQKFNLTETEKNVLLSKNGEGIEKLGFEEEVVAAAMSGAHSSTCQQHY
ncbi:hypothetical protein [Planococcus lenghuensis]|uniref:Extradiol ring-cleavage dioxygenase LigAB LigA subunit domain-containing protein n=1 Tax=Planococcus lenghuensis TaxID=2213202 RepID=A0A1Q2L4Q7_9BACL|nr:hypothetical protein [Planococcus lenghuensis]AQQ55406.1 hypothetical protein B0X71_19760 [Planococcus lenghuensis]